MLEGGQDASLQDIGIQPQARRDRQMRPLTERSLQSFMRPIGPRTLRAQVCNTVNHREPPQTGRAVGGRYKKRRRSVIKTLPHVSIADTV